MSDELKPIIEALIFASPDPLAPKALFRLLDSEPQEDVAQAVAALRADYEAHGGLQMVEVAGGYQICTRPELHEWVRKLFHEHSKQRLSVQALETLAVVAYKQPITGAEISEIRGVNTSGVIGTLLERQLVKVVGRKQVVGRPFLYATTREFLNRFGLSDLEDLPKVEEMAEALGMEVPTSLAAGPSTEPLPFDDDVLDDGAGDEGAVVDDADGEDETVIEGVATSNATDGPVIREESDESYDSDPD